MKQKSVSKVIWQSKHSVILTLGAFFFVSLFFFQNCSDSRFGTADMSQVSEETILEAGPSRTISLSSKYNSELNSQPVKVAIIVDNSQTMASSQENLARNLASLFSEISKYDSDVTVLSTSWRDYLEAGKIELIDSSLTNFDRLEVDLTSI